MLNDEYMENRGKYKDRIDTELDIYFDGNYGWWTWEHHCRGRMGEV